MSTPEHFTTELERLTRFAQSEQRLPSLTAAVLRDGEVVWATAIGEAEVSAHRQATTNTQYRLGSITKTFTAAALMQLRDRNVVDLDAPLDTYLPGAALAPSIRRLMTHMSGLQREAHDYEWLTNRFAS